MQRTRISDVWSTRWTRGLACALLCLVLTFPRGLSAAEADEMMWVEPVTGMKFLRVPGGCFQMGCGPSTQDCRDNESPVHEVCVNDFYIGKYEVTQGEWEKIMGENPSFFLSGDNFPVDTVSWDDAKEFIRRMASRSGDQYTFRLPSEAEWEYACRSGGKPELFSGGAEVDPVAWYYDNSGHETHRVGSRAPNGLGIHDMSGNVWEWCEDIYSQNAYKTHKKQNPLHLGKETGEEAARVWRGGSWFSYTGVLRCSNRSGFAPQTRYGSLGFRVVRVK